MIKNILKYFFSDILAWDILIIMHDVSSLASG